MDFVVGQQVTYNISDSVSVEGVIHRLACLGANSIVIRDANGNLHSVFGENLKKVTQR